MKNIRLAIGVSYALMSSVAIASDPPESIVFNSIMIATPGGGHGFVSGITEIGQSITLAGTARHISQIDLLMQGFPDSEFRVRFYSLNDPEGAPSALIWESPTQRYAHTNGVQMVDVPNVLVPDSMAYTVVELPPYNTHLSLRTSFGADIGTHENNWVRQGGWRTVFNKSLFSARLLAVPEPPQHWIVVGLIAVTWITGGLRSRGRSL